MARNVRKEVLALCTDLIRDAVFLELAQLQAGNAHYFVANGYPECDYQAWVEAKEDSEGVARVVELTDERMQGLHLTLENVRVESKEVDLRRITCLADLGLGNGKSADIRYRVQYTEEDRLYVEVEFVD